MSRLEVWAPRPSRVEVVVGERRLAMDKGSAPGWWTAEVPGLAEGVDYGFSLDGGPPRPDPRSRWQPHGVHGLSRWVDPSRFTWTDEGFRPVAWPGAIVHELHVGTFTPGGTFASAIDRLGDLVTLGVTHVEVMPVAAFPGQQGWGYDGVSLFAVHQPYGGPAGFQRFVDACHARGLAVILDVVYNHLGPSGNYLGEFGPYFTERHHTPWGSAVNLDDAGCDETRQFFIDNAIQWAVDYHVDGLRLDAVHAMVDTGAVHFLEALTAGVKAAAATAGRQCTVIAESDLNDPRLVRPTAAGGLGLDAMWSDDFHHALHALLTGERTGYYADFGTVADLARALRTGFVFHGQRSAYRQRRHGRSPDGLHGHHFVVCSQNHDQVGNRARGERLVHLVGPDGAMVAAAITLFSPFVPLLFQGEEWGASAPFQYFTDHQEPELARAVREGRRQEFAAFGWNPDDIPDPQSPDTARRSTLDWDEREREPHRTVLRFHRELIALRRRWLLAGPLPPAVELSEAGRWLTVTRGSLTLACTVGDAPAHVPIPAGSTVVAHSRDGWTLDGGHAALPPLTAVVVQHPFRDRSE